MPNPRYVQMVLSPSSLSWPRGASERIFRNSVEPVRSGLTIESKRDEEELTEGVMALIQGRVNLQERLAERQYARVVALKRMLQSLERYYIFHSA